jgi:hypothetical protein
MCVRHTAADAFFRDYQIVIAKDGAEAFTAEDQEEGLKYLENVYNAKMMLVNNIIQGNCEIKFYAKPFLLLSVMAAPMRTPMLKAIEASAKVS